MSMISTVTQLLSNLPTGVVTLVYELVKTIVDAPEGERETVARRALMAAASKAGTIAGVDAVLKAKNQ